MKRDIRDRWVDALRSGRYTQTEGCLRDAFGYCCLGVLCDLLEPDVWGRRVESDDYEPEDCNANEHDGAEDVPTPRFQERYGLPYGMDTILAKMNDGYGVVGSWDYAPKHSFAEIADYIEREIAADDEPSDPSHSQATPERAARAVSHD